MSLGKAAFWTGILLATPIVAPVAMKHIHIEKMPCAINSEELVAKLQEESIIDDPVLKAQMADVLHKSLSGDCHQVVRNATALIKNQDEAYVVPDEFKDFVD